MQDGSYVVIQAFMVNDLKLKGNELIVYAAIYGFTQDGEHWFYGTKGYLAEWCGATKGTVGNCLKSLVGKGLLERREQIQQGQIRIEYRATKIGTPSHKNCDTPHTKIAPINNLDTQPNEQQTQASKPQQRGSYDAIIDGYTESPELRDALREFIKMRKMIKAPMTDRALTNILAKLDRMAGDDATKVAILDQSIERGWRGVFELKDAPQGAGRSNQAAQQQGGFDAARYNYF